MNLTLHYRVVSIQLNSIQLESKKMFETLNLSVFEYIKNLINLKIRLNDKDFDTKIDALESVMDEFRFSRILQGVLSDTSHPPNFQSFFHIVKISKRSYVEHCDNDVIIQTTSNDLLFDIHLISSKDLSKRIRLGIFIDDYVSIQRISQKHGEDSKRGYLLVKEPISNFVTMDEVLFTLTVGKLRWELN